MSEHEDDVVAPAPAPERKPEPLKFDVPVYDVIAKMRTEQPMETQEDESGETK